MSKVGIIMGSKSDYDVCLDAINIVKEFGVECDVKVVSAHRTPDLLHTFAKSAKENYDVVIAAAGGSAHLPGMVAASTNVPVIGLPIKSKTLKGVDSLLSIVQMPPGVPVATVAINGGKNAGLLALQMLAINDDELYQKLNDFKHEMEQDVLINHNEAVCS